MNRHRGLILCLLLAGILLTAGSAAADTGTTEGRFLRLDQGDYMHLVIIDRSGKERDYFVMGTTDPGLRALLAKPNRYRGRRVRVSWVRSMRHIPEAGKSVRIIEARSVRIY